MAVGNDGEKCWGAGDDKIAAVGTRVRFSARGRRFWAKKLKPSRQGSISGVPLQTAVGNDGEKCWGAGDDEIAVVGTPVRFNTWGRRFWTRKLKPSRRGSISGVPLQMAVGDDGEECWGAWDTCSVQRAGVTVLDQKTETEPPGLNFGCATANGSRAQWRGILGCQDDEIVEVGTLIRFNAQGQQFWAKTPKSSRWGSIWVVLLEMAMERDGMACMGVGDKVWVVVWVCTRSC
jgi:hypothetical protein